MNPIQRFVNKVREINRRYANPKIRMSGARRVVLLSLRIYLIVLVILLVYKFSMIV